VQKTDNVFELGPCGKHSGVFWIPKSPRIVHVCPNCANTHMCPKDCESNWGHCSLCALIKTAYERGKRDAAKLVREFNNAALCDLANEIETLQDRGE
jgi:hypothetical protein